MSRYPSFAPQTSYVPEDQALLVISQHSQQKHWWRNLRRGPAVVLQLRGERTDATAEVIELPAAVADYIEQLIARLGPQRASAQLYMDLDTNPPLTREQLERALSGVVLIRVTPQPA